MRRLHAFAKNPGWVWRSDVCKAGRPIEFTTPEQLGALAVFLCSDAASQLNGVPLPVDGGWLAR